MGTTSLVVGDLPELREEGILGGIVEEKGPVYRSGHDVVDGVTGGSGGFDASGALGGGARLGRGKGLVGTDKCGAITKRGEIRLNPHHFQPVPDFAPNQCP